MEPLVYKATLVPLAHKVMWALPDLLAAQDPQEPAVSQALTEQLAHKVLKAVQDQQDSQVAQDPLAFRVPLDCRVPLV
jgi:hypothetical protein